MSRIAYILTEEDKQNLLKELELEKLRGANMFARTEEEIKAQEKGLAEAHRRFHCIVCKYLS